MGGMNLIIKYAYKHLNNAIRYMLKFSEEYN